MTIGFHYMGCTFIDSENRIWVRGQFGKMIDETAKYCNNVYVFTDSIHKQTTDNLETNTDYCLQSNNIKFISLGNYYLSPIKRLFHIIFLFFKLPKLNFLIIRLPSRRIKTLGILYYFTPKSFLMGGDWEDGLISTNLKTQKRAISFTNYLKDQLKKNIVFVNNEFLYQKWSLYSKNIHLTRTTTIFKKTVSLNHRNAIPLPLTILFAGRVEDAKGILELIECCKILKDDNVDFQLKIAGTFKNDFKNIIDKLIEQNKLNQNVKFLGYLTQDNLEKEYENATIYILPTKFENLSRSIWEAMSKGCPVITTPVGGQGLAFKDETDLLFCEPNSAISIKDKINLLLQNVNLYSKLSKRGIELAKQNTVELRTKELITITQNWINQKK